MSEAIDSSYIDDPHLSDTVKRVLIRLDLISLGLGGRHIIYTPGTVPGSIEHIEQLEAGLSHPPPNLSLREIEWGPRLPIPDPKNKAKNKSV